MSDIILHSGVLEVVAIKKKTQAELFKDLQVGDHIVISADLYQCFHAKRIKIDCAAKNQIAYKTFNTIGSIVDCFEFKIVR